ncbi:MAG TPA: plastocyanin/azurin family copper-binding protein [Spirochaetia bacterium]|nr:plastocyanin/azurin family copper-binding protein [Spirochaetia bacterium]
MRRRVNDPKGKVIDNVEIPPNGTITTQVTFSVPGDYSFFRNHPLHADFGMRGHVIVSGS